MIRTVLLDSGPLGLLSAPPRRAEAQKCKQWLADLIAVGVRIIVPEIADYEVRRELLRASKVASVGRLDALALATEYLALTTAVLRHAAELWASARQRGQPTAGDDTIDADVILAAQAILLGTPNFVIATTNVGHIARFVPAGLWYDVQA